MQKWYQRVTMVSCDIFHPDKQTNMNITSQAEQGQYINTKQWHCFCTAHHLLLSYLSFLFWLVIAYRAYSC